MANTAPGANFELVGSPAIVTGGGRGIGYDIARHLMAAGADVLIFDIDGELAEQAARTLTEESGERRAIPFVGDVADEEKHRDAFDLARAEFGTPRILVNDAPHNELRPIVRFAVDEWRRIFDVMAMGTFLGTREFGRRYMEEGLSGGAIVNISTLNYLTVTPGLAAYSAAKAAISNFTKTAAMEYAPMNIRVNAICPGLTRTPLAERFFGDAPDVPNAFVERTPMGRVGRTEDQAKVAVFLASEASGWITGLNVHVDGGAHLVGVPDNWEVMKGPLGLEDPTPAEWQR
jgi:NAD(P)-dependent dehydrogenase (short-subunit alcohol dehydrogenase family)